ncbi:MAG: InlB B-repeat-containing protein [Paludibacteraceae bacterium]|nr:InlB B-repeat-containing protein [Paludibacteraceae bacterium]
MVGLYSNTSSSSNEESVTENGSLNLQPINDIDDENSNKTINITSTSIRQLAQRTSKVDGSNVLRLTAQQGGGTSPSDKQQTVYLDFELESTYYNAQYIPSGEYDIKTSGTPRVVASNGKGYLAQTQFMGRPSNFTENYPDNWNTEYELYESNYSFNWFLKSGSVKVINPNHSTYPMYVYVDAKNGNNKTCRSHFWSTSEPTIYTISSNGNGTVSTTPQYADAPVAGSDGLQYYNGTTNVTIDASPAAGYEFSKWSDNNTNAHRTGLTISRDYAATFVQESYNLNIAVSPSGIGTVGRTANAPYHYNQSIELSPAITGYTFTGWSGKDADKLSGDVFTFPDGTDDQTYSITANYSPATYNITYRDQGNVAFTGTQTSAPTTHTYGTATTLNIPTKEDYNFGGWFTASDCQSGAVGNTTSASLGATDYTADVTLYAKWTQTVTLNQNGATTDGTASVTATYNGTIGSIANNPSKTGYDFGGWCDASGSLIISTNGVLQSNVTNWTSATGKWIHAGTSTLYAKWTQVVTLDKNGGSANGTVTVTYNANTTASFSAVTGVPEGYSALKGYYDAATGGNKIFNADGSLVTGSAVAGLIDDSGNWIHTGAAPSIYAQFTPNTNTNYTVKHWQQNLADNYYTEVTGDRQQKQGTTDDATAAEAKTYTGFAAQTITQGTIAGDGSTVVNIYYNRDTYTVNLAVSPAEYGSVSPSAAITGVRYGTVITTGTGENANKVTINKTVVTANPAATTAEYTYTFDNWINGTATVTGSGLTVTANFTRTTNTYDIVWKSEDGTSTLETDEAQAYGTATAYNGATTPTKTVTGYTYTFDGWATSANGEKAYNNGETPTVSGAATYYAHFTGERDNYTITYNGLEGATNSNNPTSYNVETPTITLQDPGTRDGYIFAGWKDESDNTITQIAKGSTGNRTLTATWNVKSSNIELCENCNDAHYNAFKTNYNGETVNVTYKRQFAEGRWSTMCLPFSLDLAAMITHKMSGCVYEFKYATGNANVGSGVNLYFSNAKSIEAGKCYIVNANSALETKSKTSFVFSGVTIDLSKDNGAALDSEDDYDDLPGYKSQGTIELVGTLRNGTLKGSDTGNTYMGLKSNKIYYPNTGTGSTIWAYRGIFRSSEILDKESMQKMRIIVDGEDRGELILDADGDILAPSDAQSRKFIRDGVLYIEREGVVYDAQGKRVEGM